LGKIVSAENLIEMRAGWRREGKKVVAASGAFDLLHPGHVRLLEQARPLGDILIVIVQDGRPTQGGSAAPESAAKIQPVTPIEERAEILAALAAVDFVVALEKADHASAKDFLQRLQPDVYVQGGATSNTEPFVRSSQVPPGYRVVNFPLEPGYSTAQLIQRIQHLRQ
jgi:rfaE bifunctional protein nucleotidyltransferase chain/domain